MKSTYVALYFLIIVLSTFSYGQLSSKGLKIGISSANVVGEDALNPEPHSITTFNIGIFTTHDINGMFSIQPEIIYSRKGFMVEQNIVLMGPYKLTVTGTISYLEIPVLFKYSVPISTENNIKPSIFLGPEVGFKLNAKMRSDISGQPSQENDMSNIKSPDFGAIIGIGADINLFNYAIMFDIRYDYGFTSINTTQNSLDVRNSVISFNVGFKIL